MHTRPTRRFIALICAFGALAAACGGDDDGGGSSSGADSAIGKALAADMLSESEDGSPVKTEAEAQCWSGRIVDGIGEDRLEELGVTSDNVGDIEEIAFTDDEVSEVVSGLFDCTDVRAAFAEQFEADFGAEGAQCVADELDEDLVTEMMTSAFAGGTGEPPEEFFQAFLDIAAKCDLPLG